MLRTLPAKAFLPFILVVLIGPSALPVLGQFGPAQTVLPAGSFPKLEALDIDGDGDLDLFGHFNGFQFKWGQNIDGQGTLADPVLIAEAPGITTYVLGDVSGNGLPDVVYVDADNAIQLLPNLGGGAFGAPQLVHQLAGPAGRIILADVSNNGSQEIISTVHLSGISRISIIPNSNGLFGTPYLLSTSIEGMPPTILLAGDVNNNNGVDLVYVNEDDAAIGLMNINGDGSEWQAITLFNLFSYPFVDPILLDVDGDGDLDIAEANAMAVQWADNRINENIPFNEFTVRILEPLMTAGIGAFAHLGCGVGASVVYVPSNPQLPLRWSTYLPETQRFSPRQDLPSIPRGTTVLLADMNGNGKPDLLIGNDTGLMLFNNQIVPPTTQVIAPVLDTVCVSGPSIPLPDGLPAGGIWSGTWVSDNIFHRASVGGTSTVPMAYTWHEPEGCPVGDLTTIRVISGPTIQPFLGSYVCSGEGPIQMSSTPQATEWFGLSDGNILDLDTYNGEQIVATYVDVTGSTCVSFMGPLNIWSTISAAILPAGPFCISDGIQTIVPELAWGNNTWGGDISGTAGANALFDPSQGAGTYTITLSRTPTGPQQCANSGSITIVVTDDVPELSVTQPPAYCASTSSIDLDMAEPLGGVWSGPGVSGDVLLPFIAGPGTHVLTYTYDQPGGCSNSIQTSITLASSVAITADQGGPFSFCIDLGPVTFHAMPEGGEWSAPVTADGQFDPAQAGVGVHELIYVYTDPNGCMLVNPPAMITVNTEPTVVSIEAIGTVCISDAPFEVTGTPTGIWSGAVPGIGTSVIFDPALLGVGIWPVSLTAELEGYCPATTTVDIEVEICTEVQDVAGVTLLSVYPNPTTGMCMVHIDTDRVVRIDLYDAAGRSIPRMAQISVGATPVPLDLTDLANGVYHVRVMHGDRSYQVKILKAG